ncbi:hypothetical protein BCR32DRAFT_273775 [Anaeromyces robustus]|uniref:Transglutaminase-like domain-containing protein n=1 Tax=Anaeromyces robustus TaxID=1754192 RepID=A0A1Y1XR34_9FUNG|nr:hypothetical protein BCR32DRAFT_273775 [Anaeromyces robustus]|eukprot:ORX88222.1 hypothetical protein BCR32DRAFT_273775 [Anaeromyces robustus]
MKCLGSYIILTLLSIVSVFSAPPSRYLERNVEIGDFKYHLYSDGKATIYKVLEDDLEEVTIPGSIEYNHKYYLVNEIAAKTFTNKSIYKIIVDSSNTDLLIKKNAFYETRLCKEFAVYSQYVSAEIGGFSGIGNYVQFLGAGIPHLVDTYSEKLLKKWNLPVRKNYQYVKDSERNEELIKLGEKVQETFGHYDNAAYPNSVANVMFMGVGSSEGLSRLYRVIAITMGIPDDEVLAGGDNIHFSWNYVKINIGKGKKWYILDIIKTTEWNVYKGFTTDAKKVEYLKSFYGEYYDIKASNFVIFNNRYNYPYESRYNYNLTENFNSWLSRNNGGIRA